MRCCGALAVGALLSVSCLAGALDPAWALGLLFVSLVIVTEDVG